MGFWSRLFGEGGDSRKTGYQEPKPPQQNTAAPVNFDSAMSVSAYWASARLLSEVVAAMPLKCYEINEETGVKKPKKGYELHELIKNKPNRYQTSTEFIESLMLGLVTCGNAYILQSRTSTGRIVSLMPLVSSQMEVRLDETGAVLYEYSNAKSEKVIYSAKDIWHIKLFGNGIVGLSPLGYAAKSLGLAIKADEKISNLAKNGGKASGVIKTDAVLKPEQRDTVRRNAQAISDAGDGLFVLEAGMEYQQIALSPNDMQLLESRRFQIEDIARFMGVPSVLINDTAATTVWGSGIEQINQGFYKLNLRPYLERIESSIKRWLMPESDWDNVTIEFDFDALLRADKETRIKTNATAINSGQLTPNESRMSEGLESQAGGDKIYLNGSLVPAGTNRQQTQDLQNATETPRPESS